MPFFFIPDVFPTWFLHTIILAASCLLVLSSCAQDHCFSSFPATSFCHHWWYWWTQSYIYLCSHTHICESVHISTEAGDIKMTKAEANHAMNDK